MLRRFLLLLTCSAALSGQKYNGPQPEKPDLPYLVHADSLVETEVVEAKEEKKKDDLSFVVAGASSTAKTPLAGPVFIFEGDKLSANKIQLYKFEVKNGRREVLFSHKGKLQARNANPGLAVTIEFPLPKDAAFAADRTKLPVATITK